MTELKPCPFCGSECCMEYYRVRKGFEVCARCRGCEVAYTTTTYDTQAEATKGAIEVWNKRVGE